MSIKIILAYCLERNCRLCTGQGGKIQGKSKDLPPLKRRGSEWRDQGYYTSQKRLLERDSYIKREFWRAIELPRVISTGVCGNYLRPGKEPCKGEEYNHQITYRTDNLLKQYHLQ